MKTRINIMNIILHFLLFVTTFSIGISSAFAQVSKISIDSLVLENTSILFESYSSTGKLCENNNGMPKYCTKAIKRFENNLEDLSYTYAQALKKLNYKHEVISKLQLEKEIYEDKNYYRYFFYHQKEISKKGSSCFSNPGALLIRFFVHDRLLNTKHQLDLDYAFFICDVDLLVNKLNEAANN